MFTFTLANLFRYYSLLQGITGIVLSIPVSRIVPYFPILMSQRRERYISPPKVFHPVAPHLSAAIVSAIF